MSNRTSRQPLAAALAFVLFCSGATQLHALNPQRAISQYGHDQWIQRDGLNRDAVRRVVQTAEGHLWLRTPSGLLRFDGTRFVRIEPVVNGVPIDEAVRAIELTPDRQLLVRTRSRTLIGRDGQFHDLVPPQICPSGIEQRVFQARNGTLWISSDSHVFIQENTGVFKRVISRAGYGSGFHESTDGSIWIATGSGLYRYHHGKLVIYPSETRTPITTYDVEVDQPGTDEVASDVATVGLVRCVETAPDGTLWVGVRGALYTLVGGHLRAEHAAGAPISEDVRSILFDRDHNIWAGSNHGLYRRTNSGWSKITASLSLSSDQMLSMCEDREGSLWVGTSHGLDRLRDTKLVAISVTEGLPSEDVNQVVESADGSVYLWCDNAGLAQLQDGGLKIWTEADGLAAKNDAALFEDHEGALWIGTRRGLNRLRGGRITSFSLAPGKTPTGYISAIGEDGESVIIGSETGTYRFKDGAFTPLKVQRADGSFDSFAPGTYLFTIYHDHRGVVWFGTPAGSVTPGGLYRLEPGVGLVNEKRIPFSVYVLHDDGRGHLWIRGNVPGITRFDPVSGEVVRLTRREGLHEDQVDHILSDLDGNLWMSSARGIFMVERQELDDFAAGRTKRVHCRDFDTADGMKSAESTSRRQQSGSRTRDGRLWFSTQGGVVVIDPKRLARNELAPPVTIDTLVADRTEFNVGAVLAPGTHNVEIHYAALSLLIPHRVQFRYMLEGFDRDWTDAGNRRVAYYTQLPPGPYRFRVIASNNDGVWNEIGASITFSKAPYFYQTRWFLALCVGVVTSSLFGVYQLRVRQLHRSQRQLHQLVDERTKSLQEEIVVRKSAQAEAERIHKELMVASHQAGMAEVATGVLHNVGNVLNSANVSVSLLAERVQLSKAPSLGRVVSLLDGHATDLGEFITADPRGSKIPEFLKQLGHQLMEEQKALEREIHGLRQNIEHIKEIVAMQQSYARVIGAAEKVKPLNLVEDAIQMNAGALMRHEVELVRDFQEVPEIVVEKHKVLQIVVNLIRNAKQACEETGRPDKKIVIRLAPDPLGVAISITDNGIGIPPENLTRIFSHGFTTKKSGHGFGLHSGALAAKELGGSLVATSAGPGQGATFTLTLPLEPRAPGWHNDVETVASRGGVS